MQKLNDFVNFYEGKKVDFDGAYGAQCVDLFRQYNKEVYNLPHTGVVNGAKDLFLQYDNLSVEKRYYEKISKEVKPIAGDVVIFGESRTNEFGHVAIVLYANSEYGYSDGSPYLTKVAPPVVFTFSTAAIIAW